MPFMEGMGDGEKNYVPADSIAQHTKDAFMLRAPLWEVQTIPA